MSNREFDVAIGAKVVSAEGRRIQVRDDDGKVKDFYLCEKLKCENHECRIKHVQIHRFVGIKNS